MMGREVDIVVRARAYLAENAAESGADVLIAALADEVDRYRDAMCAISRAMSPVKKGKP